MGYSIGVIAIKGNHLDKSDKLFNAFDYVDNGESKTFTSLIEMGNVLGDYFEYSTRDIALRGIWEDNGWTIICDPETVDLFEDEKLEVLSRTLGEDIWTILIEMTSGSYSFSKFSPSKVRHIFVSGGQITDNEGMPLPEEQELNIGENIFADDLESLARTLGFKVPPNTSGDFVVKYLTYNEQMKARLAQFKQKPKSQPTEIRNREKIVRLIPLGLMVTGLSYTTIRTLTTDTALIQGHWIAYGLTFAILITYFVNAKLSNVILGITLVLGLMNVITFTPTAITIGGGLTFPNSEIKIAVQLFSLIASVPFFYVHRQAIVNWFNRDGL